MTTTERAAMEAKHTKLSQASTNDVKLPRGFINVLYILVAVYMDIL